MAYLRRYRDTSLPSRSLLFSILTRFYSFICYLIIIYLFKCLNLQHFTITFTRRRVFYRGKIKNGEIYVKCRRLGFLCACSRVKRSIFRYEDKIFVDQNTISRNSKKLRYIRYATGLPMLLYVSKLCEKRTL